MLHVAVQLGEENAAVTPAGKGEAENDTAMGLPVTSVAVMPSVAEFPGATESAVDPADSAMVDDAGGSTAVVSVESDERVVELPEFVEPTWKWYSVEANRFETVTECIVTNVESTGVLFV